MERIGNLINGALMGIEKTVQFSRSSGGERIILDSGTYEACLSEVANGTRRKYQSEEMELCIKFRYEVYTEEGTAFIWRDVAPAVGEKANLQKDFRAMTGMLIDPKTPDLEIIKILEGLVGKHYLVTVQQKKSQSGALRNQFMSVTAMPKVMGAKGAAAVTQNDDDIPF